MVYHVLNRATEGRCIFEREDDYRAFLHFLRLAGQRFPVRVCGYCVMKTHWHLIVWPSADGALSAYAHWLTTCHSIHYRARSNSQGRGHVYQERFKNFAIETSRYYYNALKYVESNALRAHYVERAEDWPWSSAHERVHGGNLLTGAPLDLPSDWIELVNTTPPDEQLEELRASAVSGRPYGSPAWTAYASNALSLGRLGSRPR